MLCRSGEQTPLQCVARHPTQHHIVATGAYDGVLSVWDLRQEKFPVTPLEAHSAASKTFFLIFSHLIMITQEGTIG
jgi:WD40 repeat protein